MEDDRERLIDLPNGQHFCIKTRTELLTIEAAAYTVSKIKIPAQCVAFCVSARVVTAIPTATAIDVGTPDAEDCDRLFFATDIPTAAGSTSPGTQNGPTYAPRDTAIWIYPNQIPAAATGQVRLTIVYYRSNPPTS